jgi:hypothetical protein
VTRPQFFIYCLELIFWSMFVAGVVCLFCDALVWLAHLVASLL